VFAIIYAAYYAMAVVGNETGAGDLWWGRVISVSMGAVAITSPLLGGVADRAGIRRPLFIGFTALSVMATALMFTVQPGMVVWGFVLGVVGNFGYESALVYYNAYLPDLAPQSHQGRVSAWAFAALRQERSRHGTAGLRRHLPRGRRQSACRHPRHRQLLPHRARAAIAGSRRGPLAHIGRPPTGSSEDLPIEFSEPEDLTESPFPESRRQGSRNPS
jgi:hypothetical protein